MHEMEKGWHIAGLKDHPVNFQWQVHEVMEQAGPSILQRLGGDEITEGSEGQRVGTHD
jgi:hypothetical protein